MRRDTAACFELAAPPGPGSDDSAPAAAVEALRACRDFRLHGSMRTLARRRRRETLKISHANARLRSRIAKILLVEGVEKIGVTAVERCGFKHAGKEPAER